MNIDLLGLVVLLAAGWAVFALVLVGYTAWMLTHPPRRGYAWAVSRGVPGDPAEVVIPGSERKVEYTEWDCVLARDGRAEGSGGGDRGGGRAWGGGGVVPVWDVRGWRADGRTVVVLHGWGDSRVTMLARLRWLVPMCARVVMVDLRGHGESGRRSGAPGGNGRPRAAAGGSCSLGVREVCDVMDLVEQLRGGADGRRGTERVVLMGFSLGAGVAIAAAALRREPDSDVAGVIAEAPYRLPRTPAERVLRLRGLPSGVSLRAALAVVGWVHGAGLSWWGSSPRVGRTSDDAFDRAVWAGRLACPLLVLHGERDDICPIEDGEAIAAAAANGRLVRVAEAGHLTMWSEPGSASAAADAVEKFLLGLSSERQ